MTFLVATRYVLLLYWTTRAANFVLWGSAVSALFHAIAYSVPTAPLAPAALAGALCMSAPLIWFGAEPSLFYPLAFALCGNLACWQGLWFGGHVYTLLHPRSPYPGVRPPDWDKVPLRPVSFIARTVVSGAGAAVAEGDHS
ncbi:MAG: hypothetical protein WC732_09615 [Candidatus Omnitrophota bacterium]